jgi:hypothetical protein
MYWKYAVQPEMTDRNVGCPMHQNSSGSPGYKIGPEINPVSFKHCRISNGLFRCWP